MITRKKYRYTCGVCGKIKETSKNAIRKYCPDCSRGISKQIASNIYHNKINKIYCKWCGCVTLLTKYSLITDNVTYYYCCENHMNDSIKYQKHINENKQKSEI